MWGKYGYWGDSDRESRVGKVCFGYSVRECLGVSTHNNYYLVNYTIETCTQ